MTDPTLATTTPGIVPVVPVLPSAVVEAAIVAPVVAQAPAKHLVDPNLSAAVLDPALAVVTTTVAPFIPAKVRAAIYVVAPIATIVCAAVAPVVGGTIGTILDAAAAAFAVLAPAVAVSHIKAAPAS